MERDTLLMDSSSKIIVSKTLDWQGPAIMFGLLWIVMELIINPLGNFPLNDDWFFATTVRRVIAGEGFHPGHLPNLTLFTHVVWAAMTCFPFDCSDQTLRLETLGWGLAGILAVHRLLMDVGAGRLLALMGALTIAGNPLYLSMANTFMTEVPFTVMLLLSAILFLKDIRGRSTTAYVAATFVACAATLSRQIAIAVPVAYTICALQQDWLRGRRVRSGGLVRAVTPSAVCVVTFAIFELWLHGQAELPSGQSQATIQLLQAMSRPWSLVYHVSGQALVAMVYYGWFLAPVLMALPGAAFIDRRHPVSTVIAVAGMMIAIGGLTIRTVFQIGHTMPLYRNVIIGQGVGPLTLHDTYPYGDGVLGLQQVPSLPSSIWLAVTVIGIAGATALAGALSTRAIEWMRHPQVSSGPDKTALLFVSLITALYLVPVFVIDWYDRYLLPVMPFVLALLCGYREVPVRAGARRRVLTFTAWALLSATAVFGVLGTADYLSWNRARWAALDDLIRSGKATPQQIDGGIEFNGTYNSNLDPPRSDGKSWWWVVDDDFIITFGPLPGRRIIGEYPFPSWLHRGPNHILVLSR